MIDAILDAYPDNKEMVLDGLGDLCSEYKYERKTRHVIAEEFNKLRYEFNSGQIISMLLHSLDRTNATMIVREEQIYKKESDRLPYKKHTARLTLTDLGYVIKFEVIDAGMESILS